MCLPTWAGSGTPAHMGLALGASLIDIVMRRSQAGTSFRSMHHFSDHVAVAHPAGAIDRLKACAELLRLPWQAVATACVFFHRFKEDAAGIHIPDNVLPVPFSSPCSLQPGLCMALSALHAAS